MSKQNQKQRKGDFSQMKFKAIKDWNCSDVVKKWSPGLAWWCFWAITNIFKCKIFYIFCLDSGTFILMVIWSMLACHLYQPGVTLFLSLFLETQSQLPILYTSLLYAFSRPLNLFLKISPKLPASNHWTVCRMETVWTVLAFQNICNSSETAKIVHRMLMGRNLWSPTSWSKQDYHQVRQGFVWPHF